MKVLLDECIPSRLARSFRDHEIKTVRQMNWQGLKNGALLAKANEGFQVLITVDKNLVYQQRLEDLTISILILRAPSNKLKELVLLVPQINEEFHRILPGEVKIISRRNE